MNPYQTNTEHPMTIMGLVSSSPLRGIARIRAGLGWRKDRDFNLRAGPNGLEFEYRSRTAFGLDLGGNAILPIDLTGDISTELARRIAAEARRAADGFALIDLQPQEAERLGCAIARATPAGTEPAIPILDAYAPRNGLLVPVALVREHLAFPPPTQKGSPMPHPLQRSAPNAYDLLKKICDDPNAVIAESILFEVARAQGSCKRIDHIRGNKPPRAKSLSDADVDAVVKIYAARIVPRDIGKIDEAQMTALPDGTVGTIPLLGQSNDANVLLLVCFIAHENPGSMRLALEIDEVLPTISDAVLEGLGRKPKDAAD